MDNLGEYLRKEREKKGITIEEASMVTRIGKTYLKAIEEGNFSQQSPVFMKGFIKSYCKYLGIDNTEILLRFTEIQNERVDQAGVEKGFELEPVGNKNRYIIPTVAALSVIALLFLLTTSKRSDMPPPQVKMTAKTDASQQKNVMQNNTSNPSTLAPRTTIQAKIFKPISTMQQTPVNLKPAKAEIKPAPIPAAKTKKEYTLTITAKELTWLKITVDERNPVEVLLREGEKVTWTADNKITILAGNAGGVELDLNGKSLGSLGPTGKVATKIIP